MPQPDIVAIGEPMVEFNQSDCADPRLYSRGFGGDSSNFLVSAARQGASAGYLSAVGNDRSGELLRELWRSEGIDARHVRIDPEAATGIYFVDHDESGHHFTFYRSGSAASRYGPADLPLDYCRDAKVMHCTGVSLAISDKACDACYAAVAATKAGGGRVSFDTNYRPRLWPPERARAVILDMARLSDICLASQDDLAQIAGVFEPEAQIDLLQGLGAPMIALKLGREGAIVADATGRYRIPPLQVEALDATGAGDTFGGAFVARLLAGDGIEEAGRYAAAAAALSTTGYGAVDPIPNADQVRKAMAR
ncbi:MAG: sugar kinase [Salinarimonadaceae bacterium]|nr:MAG: sugar kinase [Salinarimonadaceae bacterium]